MARTFRFQPFQNSGVEAHTDCNFPLGLAQADQVVQLIFGQPWDVVEVNVGGISQLLSRGNLTNSRSFLLSPLSVLDIFGFQTFQLRGLR